MNISAVSSVVYETTATSRASGQPAPKPSSSGADDWGPDNDRDADHATLEHLATLRPAPSSSTTGVVTYL